MWEDQAEKTVQRSEEQPAEKEQPAAKDKGGDGKGKGAKEDPELASIRKELTDLRRERDELKQSEQYWANVARDGHKRKPAEESEEEQPEEEEPEEDDGLKDDTPDKAFEDFSAKGVEALVRRGLLTKKAAKEIIRKEAAKIAQQIARQEVGNAQRSMSADARLVADFPELQNEKSELFAKTKEIYREMVADDPSLKKSPSGLRLAARAAKAELGAAKRERGEDRLERINRQGENGRRTADFREEESDDISPGQRKIIDAFNRDGGVQISEERYQQRAKEGVRMSAKGAPQYQPGKVDWGRD